MTEFHEKMNNEGQCLFSSDWLIQFRVHHGFCKLDCQVSRNWLILRLQLHLVTFLSELVAENGLTPEQIYNADKTELMCKCLPNSTLAGGNKRQFMGSS